MTSPELIDLIAAEVAPKVAAILRNQLTPSNVKLYTIPQVAEMIGRSKSAVQHLIARGELPSVKVGRRVHVEREELERWIEMNREGKG